MENLPHELVMMIINYLETLPDSMILFASTNHYYRDLVNKYIIMQNGLGSDLSKYIQDMINIMEFPPGIDVIEKKGCMELALDRYNHECKGYNCTKYKKLCKKYHLYEYEQCEHCGYMKRKDNVDDEYQLCARCIELHEERA